MTQLHLWQPQMRRNTMTCNQHVCEVATFNCVVIEQLLQLQNDHRRLRLLQRDLSHQMVDETIWLQLHLLQPNMAYCNTFRVLH
jgi:hypothetical protein